MKLCDIACIVVWMICFLINLIQLLAVFYVSLLKSDDQDLIFCLFAGMSLYVKPIHYRSVRRIEPITEQETCFYILGLVLIFETVS